MARETQSNQDKMREDVAQILAEAEKKGINTNYFFKTTFKRYQVQMMLLDSLEKEIRDSGVVVEKEYVKGRKNLYTNPAVTEYNRTSTATNNTVSTLISIVKSFSEDTAKKESKLASLIDDE